MVDLGWIGGDPDGDPVTYDVYFGTSSSPPKLSGNQSSTTYDLPVLNFGTTYYWKIVAWDTHGASSVGPLWSFMTTSLPYEPNNPNPTNHATNVDINTDLGWTGGDPDGDPVTYDVYFGTTSPPPKVTSNQSGTIYDPGALNYLVTYYWKIVAWDTHGASNAGAVWDFTTTYIPNNPPYIPSNPNPQNNSNNVPITTDLSWTGGDPDPGDSVTYDVYFGTTNPPPLVMIGLPTTTYDLGTLGYSTTYYWRIILIGSERGSWLVPKGAIDAAREAGMLTGKRGRPSQARYIGTCPVCGREVRGTARKMTVQHFDNEGQPCTGHKQPLKRPTLVE